MTRDSLRRVVRTFIVAFAGVAIPGALSWLNGLTEWARAEGQAPFPDARSLAFLGVSAIVAGFIAGLNLLVVAVEDATGHGFLRNVPPAPPRGDRGAAYFPVGGIVVVVLVVVLLILVL